MKLQIQLEHISRPIHDVPCSWAHNIVLELPARHLIGVESILPVWEELDYQRDNFPLSLRFGVSHRVFCMHSVVVLESYGSILQSTNDSACAYPTKWSEQKKYHPIC